MTATAQEALADPPPLSVNPEVDLPIMMTGFAYWISTEAAKGGLKPEGCRLCDGKLNGLDSWMRSNLWLPGKEKVAAGISDGLLWGDFLALGPGITALAATFDQKRGNIAADELLVGEALALSVTLDQTVKYFVGRQRPYARWNNLDVLGKKPDPNDANLSFYSGHTAATFTIAVASGTVASLRGYRLAPLVWVEGLAVAATTSYLRIAADRHYFTDVLTGMLFGSAVGALVPLLHGPLGGKRKVALSAAPMVNGASVGLSGFW